MCVGEVTALADATISRVKNGLTQDEYYMTLWDRKVFCLGLVVFFFIIYAYSPIFWLDFAYHNDYRLCEYHHQHIFFGFPETRHLIAIGRPLLSILLNAQVWLINNTNGFYIAHIVSVLTIAMFAVIYFFYFQKLFNITSIGAAILAILTFTLPSMAINALWILNYVSSILGSMIALFAYVIIQKINFKQKHKICTFSIVGFLLYIDMCIYPPSVFFFLTFTFSKMLFGTKHYQETLRSVFLEILMILGVSIIYYISIKFILKPFLLMHPHFMHHYLQGHSWPSYYQLIDRAFPQYSWSINAILFSDKLIQLQQYLNLVLSAWFPPSFLTWNFFASGIFFWGVGYTAYQNHNLKRLNKPVRVIVGISLLCGIAGLTALPILVGPSYYVVHYRVTFASMALIPIVFIFACEHMISTYSQKRWGMLILLSTAIFCTVAEMQALHRIILVTQRAYSEYQWILVYLKQNISDKTKQIYVQIPITERPDRHYLQADFGFNASDLGMRGLVNAALIDIHKNPLDYRIFFDTHQPKKSPDLLWIHSVPIMKKKLSPTILIGKWSAYDRPASIQYIDHQLIINVFGSNEKAFISSDGYFLSVPAWNNLEATLSEDNRELRWVNGFTLKRNIRS